MASWSRSLLATTTARSGGSSTRRSPSTGSSSVFPLRQQSWRAHDGPVLNRPWWFCTQLLLSLHFLSRRLHCERVHRICAGRVGLRRRVPLPASDDGRMHGSSTACCILRVTDTDAYSMHDHHIMMVFTFESLVWGQLCGTVFTSCLFKYLSVDCTTVVVQLYTECGCRHV